MSESHLKFLHDLRNKIAPILIHAQLIQLQADKKDDGADEKDSAKSIEDAAKELISFVDRVESETSPAQR